VAARLPSEARGADTSQTQQQIYERIRLPPIKPFVTQVRRQVTTAAATGLESLERFPFAFLTPLR
jgi:hypothetical protein